MLRTVTIIVIIIITSAVSIACIHVPILAIIIMSAIILWRCIIHVMHLFLMRLHRIMVRILVWVIIIAVSALFVQWTLVARVPFSFAGGTNIVVYIWVLIGARTVLPRLALSFLVTNI